jgi:hypothetical protein
MRHEVAAQKGVIDVNEACFPLGHTISLVWRRNTEPRERATRRLFARSGGFFRTLIAPRSVSMAPSYML